MILNKRHDIMSIHMYLQVLRQTPGTPVFASDIAQSAQTFKLVLRNNGVTGEAGNTIETMLASHALLRVTLLR